MTAVGTNLYVGGTLTLGGSVPVNRIARWDGATWSALRSGLGHYVSGGISVFCMRGIGNDLYVGGPFAIAGQRLSYYFARWNDPIDFNLAPGLLLDKLRGSASGPFKLQLTATLVPSYVIEASTNFTEWTPLMTNATSPFEFLDPAAPNHPKRFYRARQGP